MLALLFTVKAVSLLVLSLDGIGSHAVNIRNSWEHGEDDCVEYYPEVGLFQQTCDISWIAGGYDNHSFISLGPGETFDGRGHVIDLTGVTQFHGLFSFGNISSFSDAPLVRNVNTKGGGLAQPAGFVVQEMQSFFRVHSCSSTGEVSADRGGGIVGKGGGYQGKAEVVNSRSTGEIVEDNAGGIVGADAGREGVLHIRGCSSSGRITGPSAGGICGWIAGYANGTVYVEKSHSTGEIAGKYSGGIIGGMRANGMRGGYLLISQCFSSGNVTGDGAGGLTGSHTAMRDGVVEILNSYTTGYVQSQQGGGICGSAVGSHGGTVTIQNVYMLSTHPFQSVMISSIHLTALHVEVKYSVLQPLNIAGFALRNLLEAEGNSGDLSVIQGRLYRTPDRRHQWSSDIWYIPAPRQYPTLRWQSTNSAFGFSYRQGVTAPRTVQTFDKR